MNPIDQVFKSIEAGLSEKLSIGSFQLTTSQNQVERTGEVYSIWKNQEKSFALRLSWDEKESWFIVEETPCFERKEPSAWADLVIVPFDKNISSQGYHDEIIDAVLGEIRV